MMALTINGNLLGPGDWGLTPIYNYYKPLINVRTVQGERPRYWSKREDKVSSGNRDISGEAHEGSSDEIHGAGLAAMEEDEGWVTSL